MRASINCILLAGLVLASHAANAQTKSSDALSPPELRRIVEVIANDSMLGRFTPSPELEKSAEYIASQFRNAGLTPLGDEQTFFQRYPVSLTRVNFDSSFIRLGTRVAWRYGFDYRHIGGFGDPVGTLDGPAVIVTGKVTRDNVAALKIEGKVVIFLSPLSARGQSSDYGSVFALAGASAKAIIIPGGRSDTAWAHLKNNSDEQLPSAETAWPIWTASRPLRKGAIHFYPIVELWAGRLAPLLATFSVDSAALVSSDGSPRVTSLDTNGLLAFPRQISGIAWPPNVVGVIEGSDPILKHEYLVLTAHLDHLGVQKGGKPGPESVFNGADDNASGVAVITQVAKSLAASPRKLKRSVIFVAISGEERGLWGSDYFAAHPPVPRESIVGDINLDMVGRSVADTVYVLGLAKSQIGKIAKTALGRSPSLSLVLQDEAQLEQRFPGEDADQRSDMINFSRRGIPTLFLFTGWHADYHETTDDPDKLNYDAMSRIARATFEMTVAIANAPDGKLK